MLMLYPPGSLDRYRVTANVITLPCKSLNLIVQILISHSFFLHIGMLIKTILNDTKYNPKEIVRSELFSFLHM